MMQDVHHFPNLDLSDFIFGQKARAGCGYETQLFLQEVIFFLLGRNV